MLLGWDARLIPGGFGRVDNFGICIGSLTSSCSISIESSMAGAVMVQTRVAKLSIYWVFGTILFS